MKAEIVPNNVVPDELITAMLEMSAELPADQEACVFRVREIGMVFRRLMLEATLVPSDIVTNWARRLHHLPTDIGIHPHFSNAAQREIDDVRNIIEHGVDIQLPEIARDAIVNQAHPDGIDIFLGEEGGDAGMTLED